MTSDFDIYLNPGPCIDSEHPSIVALAKSLTDSQASQRENAIALYYWVRDEIRYNPYGLGLALEDQKASHTLAAGQGWCVTKAILLAALCRTSGIPARLGFADVRNHLSTQRLRETMDTDIFYFHGYTPLFLEGAARHEFWNVTLAPAAIPLAAFALCWLCERLLRDFKFELPGTSVSELKITGELIDRREELLAATHSLEEMEAILGVDTLRYLSVDGMLSAVSLDANRYCTACFTGEYPAEVQDQMSDKFSMDREVDVDEETFLSRARPDPSPGGKC